MINKFHVLYVGQIELDNIGLEGTPANDRRYASERLSEAFATARDIAQEMDTIGFHAFPARGLRMRAEPRPARPLAGDADEAT